MFHYFVCYMAGGTRPKADKRLGSVRISHLPDLGGKELRLSHRARPLIPLIGGLEAGAAAFQDLCATGVRGLA
jgi:hypothetical protein